ncbi:MAG: hypothetical protein JKX73_01485, partial [Flavobacteriales bacterium]|nr:hypothetical protein [Flavobacteriales bacterium]
VGCWNYCIPDFATASEHICRVIFNTIDNSSTCASGGVTYEDYTSISSSVSQGSNYSITVYGNTAGNFTNYINVFIDFNNDGDFVDVGEEFQIGTIANCANCSVTSSITIDPGAVIGPTTMRVMKKYNEYSATACNTTGYGQAEDYELNICGASSPTPPITTGAARCGTGTLSLTASGASAGEDYKWYDAATGGTLLQTNGSSYTTPSIASTTTYYVTIYNTATTCAESGRIAVIATINNAPAITGQPANTSACATGVATFTVTATGSGLTYQWQEDDGGGFTNVANGGVYSGATTVTLTLTGVTAGMDTYKYRCIVSGTCTPTVTSDGLATLTIDAGTAPTQANAGSDQSVTTATTTLDGNTITVGSGLWTLVSGTATITTNTDPVSGITGLAAAPSIAVLRWTSTNGGCSTQDDMTITRYCLGTHSTDAGCAFAIDIANVVVSDISNASDCPNTSPNNYSDFTNIVGSVQQGTNYTITINRSGTINETWWGVWVDWNNDGDFLDAGEFMSPINAASGIASESGTLVVPTGLTQGGTYTMRIRAKNTTTMTQATVCDAYAYGEQEDYTLRVAPSHCFNSALDAPQGETSIDCGGPCFTPIAGTVSGGGSFACGANYTLTLTGSVGAIQWQYSPTNAAPWYDIQGETGTTYTDNSNNTTYFRVKVSGGSCGTVLSPSATVTITGTSTLYWRTSGGTTAWATATNWWTTPGGPVTAGTAPTSCDNAVVQVSTANPVISGNAPCGDLTIDAGAILTLSIANGQYLTVYGSIINNGTITQTTASNLRGLSLAGINTTWSGSSNIYNNLTIKIVDNSNVTMTSDATINTVDANKVAIGGILSLNTNTLKVLTEFDQSGAILHVNTGTLWLAITTSMVIDEKFLESDDGTVFFDLVGNWTLTLGGGGSANLGYYNMKFKSTGGTITISNDRIIRNNFEIALGTGTVEMDGVTAATTSVKGNFINDDNDGTPFDAGVSTINMNGSAAQNITGASPSTFNKLTINNTSSTGVTLVQPTTISNMLTLTDGELILNSRQLTITNTSNTAIAGASSTSYINSESELGILRWNTTANADDYTFPFGYNGSYIPFTFAKNAATASDVSVSTWTTSVDNQTNIPTGVTLSTANGTGYSVDRWYDVSPSVALSADLTFTWTTSETSGVDYTTSPQSFNWNGSSFDQITGTAGTESMTSTWTTYGGAAGCGGLFPTCSDGIQNQDETSIDCGGVCGSPTTSAITGTSSVCENDAGVAYTVTNTAGSSYLWTVPAGASITSGAGTNAITVTWGSTSGNVEVIETDINSCTGSAVIFAVTVNLLPTTSAITGPATVCESDAGVGYSVSFTFGSSYAWTVPTGASITAGAGTNSITVTFGSASGNVEVTETSVAGCVGSLVSSAVTVNPAAATSAGADATICEGSSFTLSGVRGGSATLSTWTTSGDGTFDDPSLPAAAYTNGPSDSTVGSVTLTITTNDPDG